MFLLALLSFVLICSSDSAWAQRHHHDNDSYPLVYGATGRPYGPTQAHYQYQKRYGRPWHGEGSHGHGSGVGAVNGYPAYGWSSWQPTCHQPTVTPFFYSVPIYGAPLLGGYGYAPYSAPFVSSYQFRDQTNIYGPELYGQGINRDSFFNDVADPSWNQPSLTGPVIAPSSPPAVVRSVHFEKQGDIKLQELNYGGAAERYNNAIRVARDRAEPRYKMAIVDAARGRLVDAVTGFRLATELNADWPRTSPSLDQLLGPNNALEKTRIKQRAADWMLQDSRDPQRLFLLGVLLHMDRDPRANVLIDTAILIEGAQPYLAAFQTEVQPVGGEFIAPTNAEPVSTVPPLIDTLPIPSTPSELAPLELPTEQQAAPTDATDFEPNDGPFLPPLPNTTN